MDNEELLDEMKNTGNMTGIETHLGDWSEKEKLGMMFEGDSSKNR